MNTAVLSPRPARNLWPHAIIGFYVLAVIFLGSFITWAVHQREDLVATDYYQHEVHFQEQMEARQRTDFLTGPPLAGVDAARREVVIRLPQAVVAGATGKIHFYRPADARLDQEITLRVDAEGVQRLPVSSLAAGAWKVQVQWQAGGQTYFREQPLLLAAP